MQQFQTLLRKKEFFFTNGLQKTFPQAEIFLVGGIVRDLLLKQRSKDYDFVVRHVPLPKLQSWLKKQGWVDLVGKHFGVLKFVPSPPKSTRRAPRATEQIDIALPRTEHAFATGGYKDFEVQSDPNLPIEKDLERRDFTINAMAYDIKHKKLIDLFDGQKDLKQKTIRTVGRPAERFTEDYSRMLRAIRFACQLDFTIEKKTWSAIKKLMSCINKKIDSEYVVPRETIAKEMAKAFVAAPERALVLYEKSGGIKTLMPELLKMKNCPQPRNFHSEGDVWKHTKLCLQNLTSGRFRRKFGKEQPSPELVFGLLLHDLGKPYTIERKDRLRFNNHDTIGAEKALAIMKRLRLSSAGVDVEAANWLIRRHMLPTHTKKSPMKRTTLEKYFFSEQIPGDDLLKLIYADIQATLPPSGKPDFADYRKLERQINKLARSTRQKKKLPPAIIDGTDIMKHYQLSTGPLIGTLKNAVREAQLQGTVTTKQQAWRLLNKHPALKKHTAKK